MRPLQLDFQRTAPTTPAGWALLGVGLVVAGLAVEEHFRLAGQIDTYREQAERATAAADPSKGREALPVAGKSEKEALDSARLVVEHLTVPWDKLFAALEGIEEKDVAVLAITPNIQKRQIRIHGEAKNLAAVLSYHRKLQQTGRFEDVALTEHELQLQDPEKPVRFNLTATWAL